MTIWLIVVVLLLLWFLGIIFGIGGNVIYVLLIAALALMLVNLITGKRSF